MANENEMLELCRIFSELNQTYRRYVLSILKGLQFAQERALRESKNPDEIDSEGMKEVIKEVLSIGGKDFTP